MFKIENTIPFKNGMIIQGKFTVQQPSLLPGEMLIAQNELTGERIGMVRFNAVMNAHFVNNPANPRYNLSISYDGNYQFLNGSVLVKITPTKEK